MATTNQASHPGILHVLPHNVSAFEPSKPLVRSTNINTLLWIGGLGDTLGSVTYPFALAQSLGPNWSLMTCSLTSAGSGWGVRSLQTDVRDLQQIVDFVKERRPGGKVLLMGHSTGCQDCMEYVVGKGSEERTKVDGIILQAPVSDREALEKALPEAHKYEADQLALKMCRERQEKDTLPNRLTRPVFGPLAISARRWADVSTPGGADDYFSSDLSDERLKTTFGAMPSTTRLLILYSGAEESISDSLDKQGLVDRWVKIVKDSGGAIDEKYSGLVPGASHNLNGNDDVTVQDLVRRVLGFVAHVDGSVRAHDARI